MAAQPCQGVAQPPSVVAVSCRRAAARWVQEGRTTAVKVHRAAQSPGRRALEAQARSRQLRQRAAVEAVATPVRPEELVAVVPPQEARRV